MKGIVILRHNFLFLPAYAQFASGNKYSYHSASSIVQDKEYNN